MLCTIAISLLATADQCAPRVDAGLSGSLDHRVLLFDRRNDLEEVALVEPANLAKVSSQPEFRWLQPGTADLVAVAVFRRPPRYPAGDRSRLDHFDSDVVWVWHSNLGLSNVRNGASYASGRFVAEVTQSGLDITLSEGPPPQLEESGVFYWGVWAWSQGVLTHRSALRAFSVGSESVTGRRCSGVEDCGSVASFRCTSQRFCVVECVSDADCFQGGVCDSTPSLGSGRGLLGVCHTQWPPACKCPGNRTCDSATCLCREIPPTSGPAFSCGTDPTIGIGSLAALAFLLSRSRRWRGPRG